jgi:hypothetical protein
VKEFQKKRRELQEVTTVRYSCGKVKEIHVGQVTSGFSDLELAKCK